MTESTHPNVLHIIHHLSHRGGVQQRLMVYLSSLSEEERAHHQVVVLKGMDGSVAQDIEALGVPVQELNMTGLRMGDRLEALKTLKNGDYDVAMGWSTLSNVLVGMAAKHNGKPSVFGVFTSKTPEEESKGTAYTLNKVGEMAREGVPHIMVTPSDSTREKYKNVGYGDNFVVIHNGVITDNFHPQERVTKPGNLRDELSIAEGTKIIGTVSTNKGEKDYPTMLKAFRKLHEKEIFQGKEPKTHFVLVGKRTEELQPDIDAIGLSSVCHALGERDDVKDIMPQYDVFAHAATREAFGNVIVEAMLSGTPAVVSHEGFMPNIVGDTGLVFEKKDAVTMANHLEQLVNMAPEQKSALDNAARERATEHFSMQKMADKYQRLYAMVHQQQSPDIIREQLNVGELTTAPSISDISNQTSGMCYSAER